MGAGASADSTKADSTKGKKGSKGSVAVAPKAAKVSDSGAAALAKAVKDDAAAKLIFTEVDTDKNGKVSLEELKAAISKKAADLQATWTNDQLELTVRFFDRDGDGELNESEFMRVIEELRVRGSEDKGGVAAAAAIAERAKKHAECAKVFSRHKGEGGMERKHMSNLIRELNQEGIWDDDAFPALVKSEWEKLVGSTDRQAIASLDQFVVWFPMIQQQVDNVKRQRTLEEEAAAAAKAALSKAAFAGEVWECPLSKLSDAYAAATAASKTPLLIDMTGTKDEPYTALETFYSYSGDVLVELKKLVVEVSMKKTKTLEEAHEELAKKLAISLKQGRPLILLCSNSAPPFTSKYATNAARFPAELLDASKTKAILADNEADLTGSYLGPFLSYAQSEYKGNPSMEVYVPHKDFHVVVCTKFSPDDYKDFMGVEWPWELLQPIKIWKES